MDKGGLNASIFKISYMQRCATLLRIFKITNNLLLTEL
jgi:hypothetical protein